MHIHDVVSVYTWYIKGKTHIYDIYTRIRGIHGVCMHASTGDMHEHTE